jgi:hypothetical protein
MRWLSIALALGLFGCFGCDGSSPEARPEPAATGAAVRVEVLPAPAGDDVAAVMRGELERAKKDGRDLLVYVGAAWCEPCTRFHDAAAAGQLDKTFPTLRLVEFDLDKDRDRLQAAGYRSQMIPLFAVPGPDGRGTGRQIEGSVKGERAVGEITPRLKALLQAERR